jgi:hypothetical protein
MSLEPEEGVPGLVEQEEQKQKEVVSAGCGGAN